MDRFEADVMDELMDEAAEGPTRGSAMDLMHDDGYDESDEGNDSYDEWDEGEDNFVGRVLAGGATQYDEGEDEGDTYEDVDGIDSVDEYEAAYDELDGMEDAVADAMEAGDADEFFRRLRRMASGAVNVARRVGQGIGQAARVVGPIASMIPLPQAQLIGRIANVAGRMLADGADEYETFDELVDGLDEDAIDAAAPVLAGMVLRRALPSVARAAPAVRRAAVRGVAQAVRTATRTSGAPAARAVARAVRATQRTVQARQLPPRAAVRTATRTAQAVARRPQAARQLSQPLVPAARRATPRGRGAQAAARTIAPLARRVAATGPRAQSRNYGGHGVGCPHCGGRRMHVRGPVTIIVRGA
ncbi:hypothetical protein CMPELA_09810 [Cupriavidus necator]|uniref:Uncharacterized protein n=2 Tax=Cupriavidus TaxID=106589 RepID=A0AAE5ZEL7_CUPNH|nr:hypothetical protein [Cupriavidus necator]QCC00876.1 hypothetical protein E6A55_09930 [Cupriavidus necator H16]QQB76294.1 hypothetical protein I6H87_16200 [Cupriavidus necator]WKA39245.1 hypothetical protein QWP09_09940 [Cupriavidus necator]